MKKRVAILLTPILLFSFSSISLASPDFNKPAEQSGVLELFGDDDFYINGYELEDLSKAQKHKLYVSQ